MCCPSPWGLSPHFDKHLNRTCHVVINGCLFSLRWAPVPTDPEHASQPCGQNHRYAAGDRQLRAAPYAGVSRVSALKGQFMVDLLHISLEAWWIRVRSFCALVVNPFFFVVSGGWGCCCASGPPGQGSCSEVHHSSWCFQCLRCVCIPLSQWCYSRLQ